MLQKLAKKLVLVHLRYPYAVGEVVIGMVSGRMLNLIKATYGRMNHCSLSSIYFCSLRVSKFPEMHPQLFQLQPYQSDNLTIVSNLLNAIDNFLVFAQGFHRRPHKTYGDLPIFPRSFDTLPSEVYGFHCFRRQ